MQRKLLWIIFGALSIIILTTYYFLGGFHEVALDIAEVDDYKVVGNYYEGAYKRDTIATLFFNAKELLETSALPGDLSVINFEKALAQDTIKVFVGILLKQAVSDLPKHLQTREIEGGKVIRATIESHSIVMPTREKIGSKIESFAAENKLSLTTITIERYVSDDKLIIEKFIKP